MIRNIVFDIGNVLLGFEAREFLRSLYGEEKAKRIAWAVFDTGYWHELDRAVLSEDEILDGQYSTRAIGMSSTEQYSVKMRYLICFIVLRLNFGLASP